MILMVTKYDDSICSGRPRPTLDRDLTSPGLWIRALKTEPPDAPNWYHSKAMGLFFPYIQNMYKHPTNDLTVTS